MLILLDVFLVCNLCVHHAVVILEEYYTDSVAIWCPRKLYLMHEEEKKKQKKTVKPDLGLNPFRTILE